MSDIALAYVTCDKFSHVWDEWYDAFRELWGCDLPMYFCGETEARYWTGFKILPHERVRVGMWTAKLRNQLQHIPEEYVFVWLDDHIQKRNIDYEFLELVLWIRKNRPDSLRIMPRQSRASYGYETDILGEPLYRVLPNSRYRVSFSPNIFRKEFLLDVLKYNESPWEPELYGDPDPSSKIFAYHIDGWCVNKYVHDQAR